MRKTLTTLLLGIGLLAFASNANAKTHQKISYKPEKSILEPVKTPLQIANFAATMYSFDRANKEGSWEVPYFLGHPQSGKFKILHPYKDLPDNSNWDHFYGSALLSLGINFTLDKNQEPDAILKTAIISTGLGILKEVTDGYREGFSMRDLKHDLTGTATGILSYQIGKWVINKIF